MLHQRCLWPRRQRHWVRIFPLEVLYQLKICWLRSSLLRIGLLLLLLVLWGEILTFTIWYYVSVLSKAVDPYIFIGASLNSSRRLVTNTDKYLFSYQSNIFRAIKSSQMAGVEQRLWLAEGRTNGLSFLVGSPERKRRLERTNGRWKGNNENDFKETEWEIVDLIHLHQEGQRYLVWAW